MCNTINLVKNLKISIAFCCLINTSSPCSVLLNTFPSFHRSIQHRVEPGPWLVLALAINIHTTIVKKALMWHRNQVQQKWIKHLWHKSSSSFCKKFCPDVIKLWFLGFSLAGFQLLLWPTIQVSPLAQLCKVVTANIPKICLFMVTRALLIRWYQSQCNVIMI